MTIDLSNISIVDDDATIYFMYRYRATWNILGSYTYYYGSAKLSVLLGASTSSRVQIRFTEQ